MKDQTRKQLTKAGWLLFYLYIILLSYFLFFSEHYGRDYIAPEYRYNLHFFKEIKRFIQYRELIGWESFTVNILGNVLAFAPFGFLLPALTRKYRGFFRIVFLSMLFSLSVEVIQLMLKVGIFDVDDILLNTLGGSLGYIFFVICNWVYRLIYPKKNRKRGK